MGATHDLWRAGWGAVCVDEFGKVTGGCYGTCSDDFHTSLRVELIAVIQCLRRAATPIRIYVDNNSVVKGSKAVRSETFAVKGRSAKTAVWMRSVQEESAATRGKHAASELID